VIDQFVPGLPPPNRTSQSCSVSMPHLANVPRIEATSSRPIMGSDGIMLRDEAEPKPKTGTSAWRIARSMSAVVQAALEKMVGRSALRLS
jgi:hypothetical protein